MTTANVVETAPISTEGMQTGSRDVSREPHNLLWKEADNKLYIVVDTTVPTILSKNGKPMISTSRGFISVGSKGQYKLSLNIMDKR